jgi:hypothetical protein
MWEPVDENAVSQELVARVAGGLPCSQIQSRYRADPIPALGRTLLPHGNLHILLVGLTRDSVRIALCGLSLLSVIQFANIGLGVAAGDENCCGEQHNQRNLMHRSSSRHLATSFPLAVGTATGPKTRWGTVTRPVRLRVGSQPSPVKSVSTLIVVRSLTASASFVL